MSASSGQFGIRAVYVDRFLILQDRGRRFERDAEDNLLSVANPALHAARAIRGGANISFAHLKGVIVL